MVDDVATAQSRKGARRRAFKATGTREVAQEACSVRRTGGRGQSLGNTVDQQRMARKREEKRGGKVAHCSVTEANDSKCITKQRKLRCCSRQVLLRGWKGEWPEL